MAHLSLRTGRPEMVGLPGRAWVVSFDLRLAPRSRLELGLAPGHDGRSVSLSAEALPQRVGWRGGGWHHVELTGSELAIDGRSSRVRAGGGSRLTLRVSRGRASIEALIVSDAADRGSLLLHRLAELHARIPSGRFPVGADVADRVHYASASDWTSGFWPGALWEGAGIGPASGRALFAGWALAATVGHLGAERTDTHDVGFMYGESSLAAWRALCRGSSRRTTPTLCARLKQSVLSAADELLALAASNPGAGTIPTTDRGPDADTIVDSMMNIAILPWATRVTGNPAYARLASHHAHAVASLLVRPDGSTAQSVHFDRTTGRVLLIHTHQGLSNSSTWSRGEGWAVYGFAQAALALHDPGLLGVALRAADYVARHLPAGGIPLWDYDAPPDGPVDASAGVITAAGLLHLAAACRSIPAPCGNSAGRWVALGRRMLAAALSRASIGPPLGLLGSQVLNEHARGCWCDGGELIFGLTYGVEAARLAESEAGGSRG
ncbi:MAG: hypothetical protein DLM64_03140 [Solirubrobacterales bacterium]|nr:MAG: hypothetical protein DLM64_03140 [Solirubrobacterales bacterium]